MITKENIYLKIKILSLGVEAKIIREEERKCNKLRKESKKEQESKEYDHAFYGLRKHRFGIVREESRAALIAYGFINNKKYEQIEKSLKHENNHVKYYGNQRNKFKTGQHIDVQDVLFLRAARLVQKYGPKLTVPRMYKRTFSVLFNCEQKPVDVPTHEPEFSKVYEEMIKWRNQHKDIPEWKKDYIPKLVLQSN